MTFFNPPREVTVRAHLVAWSQGAILGRALGYLTGASSSFAQWSIWLASRARAGWAPLCFLPSHLPSTLAGHGGQAEFPLFHR